MKISCTDRCRCTTCQNTVEYLERIDGKSNKSSSLLQQNLVRNRVEISNKRDMPDGLNQTSESESERIGDGAKTPSMLRLFLGTESVSMDLQSQQETLVRKLDALGVALTDDVINQACVSMLKSAIPIRSSSTTSNNPSTATDTDKMSVVSTGDTLINRSNMTKNYLSSIGTNGTEHTGQRRVRNHSSDEMGGQPVNKRARSSSHNHVCTEVTEGSTDGDQTLVADDSEGPEDYEDEEESDIEHRLKTSSTGAGNETLRYIAIVILYCYRSILMLLPLYVYFRSS